jgi:tetratricopeptide (TPR) repeat protein
VRTEGKLRALSTAVDRASSRRTLVLLIEDVHWASPWVVAGLQELSKCARRLPCVLILTSRRQGSAVTPGWPAAEVVRFDLSPLANADALVLARSFQTANPDVALRCVERAQGNPLFLMQLLRSGVVDESIPGTIQSVVLARLDELPPLDKAALQAASVIGQRYELEVLRHLLRDNGYDGTTLVKRDLVRREAGEGGHWMFGHALIRDGAYASLLHSARRSLHLRAADWYIQRDPTLHAEHLDRAEDTRAAGAYLDAARAELAALRIESALRLLRRGGLLDAALTVRHALAALEGEICRDIGDAPSAIHAFERALPLAADDAQRCAAWIGIAGGYRVTGSMVPAFEALDHAEELADRASLDRELSRVHYMRGNLHFAQGNGQSCQAEHERALEFAQLAGDPECEAKALSGLGDAYYAQGKMRSAHAAFSRCVAICEQEGLAHFSIMNESILASIDIWLGRGDAALLRLARAGAAAREVRHRLAGAMIEQAWGWMLLSGGKCEQAEAHLTHGLALSREIGARRFETMCLMHLARVSWQRGQWTVAREYLRDAWEQSEQIGHGFIGAAVQGAIALMATGEEERRNALTRGEALLREGSMAHCHFRFNRDAIEASLNCGAWSQAERYADALKDFTRTEPLPWAEFQIAIAHTLAAAGRGEGDRAALLACRETAVTLQDTVYLPALDAALAHLASR